jgi:hypothetical protein
MVAPHYQQHHAGIGHQSSSQQGHASSSAAAFGAAPAAVASRSVPDATHYHHHHPSSYYSMSKQEADGRKIPIVAAIPIVGPTPGAAATKYNCDQHHPHHQTSAMLVEPHHHQHILCLQCKLCRENTEHVLYC